MAQFRYPQQQTTITGGATEAKQDTIIAELQDIDANTVDNATETTLSALNAKVTAVDTTGKATEAKQDSAISELQDVNTELDSVNAKISPNVADSNNSTSTPLGISGVFNGTATDVLKYNSVTIMLYADQDSAADGMKFQFSTDGTNWDDSNDFNMDVSVSAARRFQFPVTAQYFRISYTNGGVAQGAFRVQTILHKSNVLTSIHRIDTGLTNDRSVTVTKSVIAGETTAGGGAFVNVKVNPSGSLESCVNQATHDNLNANANLQVGDVDVSGGNPVPTSITSSTLPTGAATEAKQDTIITELQDIDANTADNATETTLSALNAKVTAVDTTGKATEAKQDSMITELQRIETKTPVDFLDSGLIDTSSTNITTAGVSVVASLAADCSELEIVEDIGQYMAITDGADVLLAYLPLGGGRVKLSVSSGTALKLASLTGSSITSGSIAINFLD